MILHSDKERVFCQLYDFHQTGSGVFATGHHACIFKLLKVFIVEFPAVAVPLNPVSPGPEIERELAAVGPVAVIVGPVAAPAWADVDRAALPTVHTVVVAEGSLTGAVSLDDLLAHERDILAALSATDRDLLADLLRRLTLPFEAV